MPRAVPVAYYHSVANHDTPSPNARLSISRSVFEWQMRRLIDRQYQTIDLQQLHDYVHGARTQSGQEVVLTFDDGFLDNYVFVYPLARKLGFKFTIYVNPEFVDPCEEPRFNWNDVEAGRVAAEDLESWGYLSWAEMRLMQESGLVDIQSHSMSHTWHFCGPRVVDFHHPGDRNPWLIWNKSLESKPKWMTQLDSQLVPFGTPIYENGRSIAVRRYFPDKLLDEHLAEFVKQHGSSLFFEKPEWREKLERETSAFQAKHGNRGRMETDDEYHQRIYYEVVESRLQIEKAMAKPVRFLCWPGGGETEFARKMALENGYLSTTKGTQLNSPDVGDPTHVHRVAALYKSNLPKWFNYQLFDGQIDRAAGKVSTKGILTGSLAAISRMARKG